jgi:hypothetical protein
MLLPLLQVEPPAYELTDGGKEAAATCVPTTVVAAPHPLGQPASEVRTPMVAS